MNARLILLSIGMVISTLVAMPAIEASSPACAEVNVAIPPAEVHQDRCMDETCLFVSQIIRSFRCNVP